MIHPAARVRSTVFAGSWILFVILSLALFTGKAQAQSQTWYVDASNSGVSGTSWSDAFSNLQEALLVALPGDEIRVAGGSYRPDSGAGLIPDGRSRAPAQERDQQRRGLGVADGREALGRREVVPVVR